MSCNCMGGPGCACYLRATYVFPYTYTGPSYFSVEEAINNAEPFKKLELKLVEQASLIDALQKNFEALYQKIDRIEKALDSICG